MLGLAAAFLGGGWFWCWTDVVFVVSNLRAFARVWDCDRIWPFAFWGGGWVFLHFVDSGPSGSVYMHSMESLILAQDERWRRA